MRHEEIPYGINLLTLTLTGPQHSIIPLRSIPGILLLISILIRITPIRLIFITTISYDMPKATGIDLTIYNAIGQKVRTLVSGYAEAGKHKIQWDARDDKGYEMASGVYIYRFSTKEFSKTGKMILMK